jgi:hypothetical protein
VRVFILFFICLKFCLFVLISHCYSLLLRCLHSGLCLFRYFCVLNLCPLISFSISIKNRRKKGWNEGNNDNDK